MPAILRSGGAWRDRRRGRMIFHDIGIAGARLVQPEPRGDARGCFARVFCAEEFRAEGLECTFLQVNQALSHAAFTLRGLHYQAMPAGEAKLVRCTAGAAFDVMVDLRPASPSFARWFGAELTSANGSMLFVPRGCAHGYMTLVPETELLYFASHPYAPAQERIVRWDDPRFAVAWPRPPAAISDKDRTAPDYDPAHHAPGY